MNRKSRSFTKAIRHNGQTSAAAIRSAYAGRPSALSGYTSPARCGFSDATSGAALSVINRFGGQS